MKTIFYSPCIDATNEDMFFESMEAATELGADLLVFPENVYTPYNEFLSSVDILNGDDYEDVLSCLYEFCSELGHAAVFNATDASGFCYSIFVNPMAHKGETFNKLYIKHTKAPLTCFDLEDYDKCIAEIFEPIIYRGRKIALSIGEDIFLPNIFAQYAKNGADLVINSFSADSSFPDIQKACKEISSWKNQVVLSVGFDGKCFAASPAKDQLDVTGELRSLNWVLSDNSDYVSAASGDEPCFANIENLIGKHIDKYLLLK